MARPTKYKEEFIAKVDEYLSERVDKEVQVVKQANTEKGYEMYDNKIKVQLPTREGFAGFIGVDRKTLDNWGNKYEEFFHALTKIDTEQHKRLIDNGLSGDYNPTIAKLILSSNHGMREKTDTDITSGGEPIKITGMEIIDESVRVKAKIQEQEPEADTGG